MKEKRNTKIQYTPEDFGLTGEEVKKSYPELNDRREDVLDIENFDESGGYYIKVKYQPVVWAGHDKKAYVVTDDEETLEITEKVTNISSTSLASIPFTFETEENYGFTSDKMVNKNGYLVGYWNNLTVVEN